MPRKIIIWGCLLLVILLAAFQRVKSFEQLKGVYGVDEVVYANLGENLYHNILDYNTIPLAHYLAATGHPLSAYFYKPLFKHPPIFPLFIMLFYKMFGISMMAAFLPALLFGLLTIPLVYLIGQELFNEEAGLLAAIMIFIDPVNIMCGQKIWMETALSFFMALSVYFFIRALNREFALGWNSRGESMQEKDSRFNLRSMKNLFEIFQRTLRANFANAKFGLKRRQDILFILSGISAGLAGNIKYPGVLVIVAIISYAVCFRRDLFKNAGFLLGLLMPVIIFIPWFTWNASVYGHFSLKEHLLLHGQRIFAEANLLALLAVIAVVVGGLLFLGNRSWPRLFRYVPHGIVTLILLFFVIQNSTRLLSLFDLMHVPVTSWSPGLFRGGPFSFYFGRLIELNPLYLFGFVSLLFWNNYRKKYNGIDILYFSAIVIFAFYALWGNYQARYILSITPFLAVLSAWQITRLAIRIENIPVLSLRILCRATFLLLLTYFLAKVMVVNVMVSYTNNMCYF